MKGPVMASRNFNRKQALENEIKEIYAKLTFGSSGAVTLTTGHGVASASKTGTGDYRITLSDAYVSLKMVEGTFLKSSAEDIRVQLKSEDVASGKTIDILTLTGASATNPSSGAVLFLKFELKNSTVV
jgi:hypothetical protein